MPPDFWRGRRVLVTGAGGFVGSSLVPRLRATEADLVTPSRRDCDLTEQTEVRRLLAETRPEVVFHLAGLVGGIADNAQRPADYCHQNLLMGTLLIDEAWRAGVRKYITLAGACSYPAQAKSPIAETSLWNGHPEPTSAPYGLAKAMAVAEAQAYRAQHGFDAIVLVPGNLYGPHDNFDLTSAHVIPAQIRRFVEAAREGRSELVLWGTGRPTRDFVFVEDACAAIVLAAETYSRPEIVNISSGAPVSIRELAETIAEIAGFRGQIRWDTSKPDGQMKKGLDVSRMRDWLGFQCTTPLRDGLRRTLDWFLSEGAAARLSRAR